MGVCHERRSTLGQAEMLPTRLNRNLQRRSESSPFSETGWTDSPNQVEDTIGRGLEVEVTLTWEQEGAVLTGPGIHMHMHTHICSHTHTVVTFQFEQL